MIKGFITNLGKYNEGELIGEWIEFPIDEDELEAVFERIGINDEYEEYFFTDWECELFLGLGEYENINELNELVEVFEGSDLEILKAITECGYDARHAVDMVDNVSFYEGMTLEELAYDIVENCYDLPEFALRYFDYEAFARDLGFDGYTEVSNGVILIN